MKLPYDPVIDMAKIDTVHIPYKGGAPALQDLLGGRVAAYYSTFSTSQAYIEKNPLLGARHS